jgi:LysR family transcriptional regulator for bpeEF and oprC
MDRLTAMRHFLAVVENGSFSSAARRLGVANATVTQSIKNLETSLGVRLLNRTTRKMTPTWEGATYADRTSSLLHELDQLEIEIAHSVTAPSGTLRVEMPPALAESVVIPRILEYSKLYPKVDVRLLLDPVASSLTENGIDVAIQLGELQPSSLIARKVYRARKVACASPSFLSVNGYPTHPRELEEMNCLAFASPRAVHPRKWSFERAGELHEFVPTGQLLINSSKLLVDLARHHGGVVFALDILVAEHLKSGELVQLLPDWSTPTRDLYVVFHDKHNLPEKVRSFAEFVTRIFADLDPAFPPAE